MTSQSHELFFGFETPNEDFVLVWLDTRTPNAVLTEETSYEAVRRQTQLETIISFTRTFNDIQECEIFIRSLTTEKIFLITCGHLGESFVPKIHALQQIEVIYIFCIDKQKHRTWAKSYGKIRRVCATTNDLLEALARDVSMHAKNVTPLSIFSANLSKEVSLRSLTAEEVRFMWFQLLLELLLRMPSNENARNDMRTECETAYRGNSLELAKIDKFFRTYSPADCIHWYTQDSFVYRLLNKAFRTENLDLIFKFRFFIVDLYHQLKQLHRPFTGTLWRGQTISVAELQQLKVSQEKLVSVNTFFSTTQSSNRAVSFSGQGSGLPQLESVVFQIDVDEKICDTPAFADVTHLSSMPHENEILFTMNTVFRLIDVESWNNIWIVHLILTDASQQKLKELMDHLKKEMDEEQIPPLLMMGEFLWKMGDFDRANRYYQMMLRELPLEHELIGKVYNNLGLIALEKGDFRLAMRFFEKALHLQEPTETLDLAETYSNIAILYDTKEETDQALDWNEKSLAIRLRLLPHDHQLTGLTYNNIGLVYFHRCEYEKALEFYEKAKTIERSALGSADHFDHATTISNIGLVHLEQGHYETALDFFKEALAIRDRSLPPQHAQFAETYNNIATAEEQLDDLDSALIMFEKALEVRLLALLPQHPSIAESYNNLANVLDALNRSDDALANYFKALKYCDESSVANKRSKAIYLNNIAECFRKSKDFDKATKYHKEALRLRLELFSRRKHYDLAMSYNNIGLLFYEQCRYDKALHYHFRSLSIREEVLQSNHPRLSVCLVNIGLVYSKQNQYKTALNYFQQALEINKRNFPIGHERIEETQGHIDYVLKKINKKKQKANC
jgi:tetratricopeptide (TPR) repeat protein